MTRRILAACLLAGTIASAQGIKPAPRTRSTPAVQPIIALPPCDPAELIELLNEYFAPASTDNIEPEYCAPRTCEAQEKAKKYAKDAKLLQSIDLMRIACRGYFRSN